MYTEDDLLPLSGLQHLAYCPRQFALIHLEQAWADNLFTAEGNVLHSRTDRAEAETRGDIHIARSLRLQSLALGLAGIADVVEFHRVAEDAAGLELPRLSGLWRPYPVEYKRGRPKAGDCDEVQVCAQALCLEEMLGLEIPQGALFYGKTRRRKTVQLNDKLRERTGELALEMHRVWRSGQTPPAVYGPKCEQCSLHDLCMPRTTKRDAAGYLDRMLDDLMEDTRDP
jgi:CRISPR-associated exonuclease Cas4